MTEHESGTKANAGLRKPAAPMRDLSTIAFYRAVALLRRNEPGTGHSRSTPARGAYG